MIDHSLTTSVARVTAPEDGTQLPETGAVGTKHRPIRGLRWLAALLATSAVLAACSAIPPQSVTDPLGLDGQDVDVVFPGGLVVQAVPGVGAGTFTVADLDMNLPINPGAMTNTIGIASARLSGASGPDTITITDPALVVRIWHGAATYDLAPEEGRAQVTLETTAAIVLKLGSCFAGACDYSYQSGPTSFGDLKLSGSTLSAALGVMTTAPSPNNGSVSLTLQADPDELAGRTLTIELEASEGEIRF